MSSPNTPTLLSLPPTILELLLTFLDLLDICSLRLVSRGFFRTFASPKLCEFLLSHHFPFAPGIHATAAYDILNALLLQRRRLLLGTYTQSFDLSYPAPLANQEPVYSGFHEFDADLGILLTVETSEGGGVVEIVLHCLGDGGKNIVIPAPLRLQGGSEGYPNVILAHGRVLLLYDRGTVGGTLAMILDGMQDGRTLWGALIWTSVYIGKKALQPVFNKHYIAFITKLDESGVLAITRLAPRTTEPERVTTNLKIRPGYLHSIRADTAGKILLAGEVYPEHNNLHRIVIVDASTGNATRAFHLPMAPAFSSAQRDWGFRLSPDGSKILAWQSPRDQSYRSTLALQVSISPLGGDAVTDLGRAMKSGSVAIPLEKTKIRYLLTSRPVSSISTPSFNFSLGVASIANEILIYPPLNLNLAAAGTGETINPNNMLTPALGALSVPAQKVEVGANWVYVSTRSSDGTQKVQLLRHSTPLLADGGSSMPPSGRSTPMSAMAGQRSAVDAAELARRLAAMQTCSSQKFSVEKMEWRAGGSHQDPVDVSPIDGELGSGKGWSLSTLRRGLSGKMKSDAIPQGKGGGRKRRVRLAWLWRMRKFPSGRWGEREGAA